MTAGTAHAARQMLAEYAERPGDEDGEDCSVFLAVHPEGRNPAALSS